MNRETQTALHHSIHGLALALPRLIQRYPDDGDFISAFAELADPIMDFASSAGGDASDYAGQRIDELLIDAGKMDPAHRQT